MARGQRLLIAAVASAILLLLVIAGWNGFFDQYADRCYLTGWCDHILISTKNQSEEKLKAVLLRQLGAGDVDAIVMGSSRATVIDPARPAFVEALGRGVNLALPGARINCLLPVLIATRAQAPDAVILFGLDFYGFSRHAPQSCVFVLPERRVEAALDALQRLFSGAVALENFRMLSGIGSDVQNYAINRQGGRRTLTTYDDARRRNNIKQAIEYYVATPGWYKDFVYDPDLTLRLARAARMGKTVFFINPVSIWHHEALQRANLGEAFRLWKQDMARLGDVLDFSETREITGHLQNYTDSNHYTVAVADLIVQDIARHLRGEPLRHAHVIGRASVARP
jgi:hypothetical protein